MGGGDREFAIAVEAANRCGNDGRDGGYMVVIASRPRWAAGARRGGWPQARLTMHHSRRQPDARAAREDCFSRGRIGSLVMRTALQRLGRANGTKPTMPAGPTTRRADQTKPWLLH